MTRIIDDWGLRYPGVKRVERVYFYRVPTVGDETTQSYLERAYRLGKEFAQFPSCHSTPGHGSAAPHAIEFQGVREVGTDGVHTGLPTI